TRPSDIVTMLNGQTVEIGNTDAEGRVILADALTYGVGRNPAYMIDIATLTGAAMVALGDRYSAVFSNDKRLKDLLVDAGAEMDDPIWELPLHKDHKEKMKSQVADLRNADAGTSYLAGASKGAAFLSYFIKDAKGKDAKWAHIDIGGTAYTNDPRKYEQKGATGSGVRVLLRFLEGL
ncbi:leucyl aminopeptidase, partial [Candidatus Peregrinibacteria bacterium]|nr:leucyl aminopeptidase [Candidatus Peregrinibacteria bacterium]